MNRSRLIIIAWLLLLVPTLLVGGMALRLLKQEQQQLAADSRAAALQRARTAADSLDLAIFEVRQGLLKGLRQLPEDNLVRRLEDWKFANPLIRNVFVWTPEGPILPNPQNPSNSEEAAFLVRYATLFQGRVPWRAPATDPSVVDAGLVPDSPRRELLKLAESTVASSQSSDGAAIPPGGWLPWFWEDGLYMLGWIEKPADSNRRIGLEIEMMALLSRLVPTLPEAPPGEIWTLVDGHGRIVHRTGTGGLEAGALPWAAQPVGSGLPHWEVRIFVPEEPGAGTGPGFRLLSFLMVGSFVAAILFGGSLLLWQAWRHMLDSRRKTSFVANVSHELKTPLTTIRLYGELLAEGKVSRPERQQHYLQVIVGESQRLTRLVNNVLDFGRLEQQQKKYHLTVFSPARHLEEFLDSQRMRLEQAGMKLEQSIPADLPAVRADEDALRQVLLNLFDNALKYAADGGELLIAGDYAEGHCRIAVKDRGPGVPPAHRERIFSAFHRVDDSLTSSRPGSGLGLSIARRLLRGMGGDLLYRPRPNRGASFEILLPPASEKSGSEEPP